MSTRQIALGAEANFIISTAPTTSVVIKDGVMVTASVEVLPVTGTTVYSASFIPVETGFYYFVVDGQVLGSVEVVTRDVFSYLNNLEDHAIGGWEWDKTTKVMVLYRQDGSTLGSYLCDDTLESAYSRPTISS